MVSVHLRDLGEGPVEHPDIMLHAKAQIRIGVEGRFLGRRQIGGMERDRLVPVEAWYLDAQYQLQF
ncbi:hypothetical protein [Brevundimonas nasdae]|uniref:hypothetical protein n=1 Tax=Brevundimonas nasdae TaxID=172043 RepID=UPI00289CA283|nr:hypothetical protein [Brevundimonas nasdae]